MAEVEGREVAVLGGGLAGLTAAWDLARAGTRVTLFEADPHLGGRSRTDHVDGFGVDVGTQLIGSMYGGFRSLVGEVGLGSEMLSAPGRDALWKKGKAHEVVYGSVASMIASGGLPLTTKMRLGAVYVPFLARNAHALDLLHPELAADNGLDNESIADWGEREIDSAFVRSLVYPQLGAFYGSRPEETSAAFYHILARYGMDVNLFAVRGGVGRVAERLAEKVRELGGEIRCEDPVQSVALGSDLQVTTASGSRPFDGVVSALPAPVALERLDGAPAAVTDWLGAVRYRPCVSVALMTDRPADARYFGLSFPRGESDHVAALCVEENKPGSTVPPGKGLIVAIVTPEMAPVLSELDPRAVIDRVLPDVERAFPGIGGRVERARVYRWTAGAPVYFPGYLRHLGAFRDGALEGGLPLALCGDYFISSSVEGAVASARAAARRLLRRLDAGSELPS